MKKVLILEDETSIRSFVVINLRRAGYEAIEASTGEEALEQLKRNPDTGVAIFDINLPGMDGFEVCRQVRESGSSTPIIMLTAREEETDKVLGLELGADDYITKPFSLAVLRARVNAQLRRGTPKVSPALSVGPFAFDFEQMDFRRDGRGVELSKTEQKLLRVLLENRGHAVPRATLVDRVWTDGAEFVEENALSVTVKRLRSKLEADPAKPDYLKTVYGIGYIWAVKP